jgi:hypothetical protein
MRKSTFIFGVLALMLFGVGTKMRAGITVQAIATKSDAITSLSSLTNGSKVFLKNVGRNKYVYQTSTPGDNYLSFISAVPTVNTELSSEYVFEVVASGTNYKLKALRSGKFLQMFNASDAQPTVGAESTAADIAISVASANNKFYLISNNLYLNGQDAKPVFWTGTGTNSEYQIYPVTTTDMSIPVTSFDNVVDAGGTAIVDGAYYRINLPDRSATTVLQQNGTAVQPQTTYTYASNQAWKFVKIENGVKIATPSDGYFKVSSYSQSANQVVINGTSTNATPWTIRTQNEANHIYNLTSEDGSGIQFYLSNYNGGTSNMGFYNVATDGGSKFKFTRLYRVNFVFKDANNNVITSPSATVTCNGKAFSDVYLTAIPGATIVSGFNVTGLDNPTYEIDGVTKTKEEVLAAIQNVSGDLTITAKGSVVSVTYKYQDMAGYQLKNDFTSTSGSTYVHPTMAIEGYTYVGSYTTDGTAVAEGSAVTDGQVIVLKYKLANNPIITSDAPTATDWGNKTIWYFMTLRGFYCTLNTAGTVDATASAISRTGKELWCFVGNETNGYKIYNKAAGPSKILCTEDRASDSANPVPMTEYTTSLVHPTWHLNYGTNGSNTGFCFDKLGATNNYINQRNGKLGEWVSSSAYSEVGSIVTFTPALDNYRPYATDLLNGKDCVGGYSATDLANLQTAYDNGSNAGLYADAFESLSTKTVVAFDADKYYRFKNFGRPGHLWMNGSGTNAKADATVDNANLGMIWKFEPTATADEYKLKIADGVYCGICVGEASASAGVAMTTSANAATYQIQSAGTALWYIKDKANSRMHSASDGRIVGWNDGDASKWYIIPATTFDLTVTAAGYATTYLPFNFKLPATGLTAYTMTSFNDTKTVVNATSVATNETTVLPKETGFVLGGSAATYTLGISSADATANIANNMLCGTLLTADLSATDAAKAYLLHATDDNANSATFYKLSGTQVNGNKAYLLYDATTTPANAFTVSFGDITGINGVSNATEEANGVYYNLAGQRVNHPTKGVYIHNGKKLIVK